MVESRILTKWGLVLIVASLMACAHKEPKAPQLFERIDPSHSNVYFMNTVENTSEMNIFNYRNFYNGGGVALGDVNGDDLPDIYFTNNTGKNKLYLNTGDFKFEDVTAASGVEGSRTWSTGVVMADVNADGRLDIYVCNAGYIRGEDQENELFVNNGDGTFTEKAEEYGLNESGYTTHAAFFDYDLDGDLDVYILNNSFMPVNTLNYENKRDLRAEDWPVREFLKGGGDRMMRNDGGRFTDVTEEAGIYSSLIGFGLGVTVGDVNGDAWPDMYISNDFFERDYLYINNGDGTFTEDIKNWISHLSLFSMGADMSDINNDGYPEIFVTDMLPDSDERLKTTSSFDTYSVFDLKLKRDFYYQFMHNTLHLNNADSTFSEISFYSGVAASDWSWGALMFDMDNDGYRDIYICNGIAQDVTDQDFISFFANDIIQKMVLTGQKEEMQKVLDHMPATRIANKAFRNNGDLLFEDVGEAWGFGEKTFSNGAAYGDLDNDGDLDLVVNNLKDTAFIYRNNSSERGQHHLSIRMKGQAVNPYALGAKVQLFRPDDVLTTEVIPSRGFQSSVDYKVVFGLGDNAETDSLVITWPDRSVEVFQVPVADTVITVEYGRGRRSATRQVENLRPGLLTQVDMPLGAHTEDDYVDFYYEGLLARKLSREGPVVKVADVNGDGTDDLFIGGAKDQAARVFFGKPDGLELSDQPGLQANADFEDTAAEFADVDNDGDLDLYVGSGGNHLRANSRNLHDRVYLNDGSGTFELSPSALPLNGLNTSAIVAIDFDEDGDIDFVATSRNIPFNYGPDPRNYVFQNDGAGKFTDVTSSVAPDLYRVGMVTDAALSDLTGDGTQELVLTGEWMSPAVYAIEGDAIRRMETSLDDMPGWWETVAVEDLDGDGLSDLVLGNAGQNFYLRPDKENPLKLWISDFDENGTVENIITRTVEGKDKPVSMKAELTEQVVSLKKESLKNIDYAAKSIQELFSEEQMARAAMKEVTEFRSVIAWNQGNGRFEVETLPVPVQLSCVCDIICEDFDADGQTDILLAGNDFSFIPQFGKLDAGYGHVMLSRGSREFELLAPRESGLYAEGQTRSVGVIALGQKRYVILGRNDEEPLVYKIDASNIEDESKIQ